MFALHPSSEKFLRDAHGRRLIEEGANAIAPLATEKIIILQL